MKTLINLYILLIGVFLYISAKEKFHQKVVGLENLIGFRILSLGDINSDKSLDIILLNNAQKKMELGVWDIETKQFNILKNKMNIARDKIILNVISMDFNFDGKLDILVFYGNGEDKDKVDKLIEIDLFLGDGSGQFESDPIKLPPAIHLLPFVADLNGDMKPDLVGYSSELNKNDKSTPTIWVNNMRPVVSEDTKEPKPFTLTAFKSKNPKDKVCKLHSFHSNSFIDFNGDCTPDLFLTCESEKDKNLKSFQIWTNTNTENEFELKMSQELPKGAKAISFGDINGKGSADMAFTTCDDKKECTIHIVYNQQQELCKTTQSTNCRWASKLCEADDNFKFDFDENGAGYVMINVKSMIEKSDQKKLEGFHWVLDEDVDFKGDHLPIPLRLGDFNLDGYPDILLTLTNQKQDRFYHMILSNTPCSLDSCTEGSTNNGQRTFQYTLDNQLPSVFPESKTESIFFDIGDRGKFDILQIPLDKSSYILSWHVEELNDAFFLKTLISNGVCLQNCPDNANNNNIKPYGVNYAGGTIKYIVSDTEGNERCSMISQMGQTSNHALLTPYNLVGLGRTNNYLSTLTVGVSKIQKHRHFTWSGIIPNSQLIIIPYQPEGSSDPASWTREMLINPSKHAKWVFGSLLASLIALGSIVLTLYCIERKQDEKERLLESKDQYETY